MELRTKRWVRLTNEDVEQLENDETDPILPGLGYRVSDTHVEYHIDCHPKLASKEPSYSARMYPNVRSNGGGQALAKIGWLNHHGEWDLQSGFWVKRLPYAIF